MRSNQINQRGLLALLFALLVGSASAQYDIHPFEENPVGISAAFGAEMALLRLRAADALLAAGVEADVVSETLEGLELEWIKLAWALEEADPVLFDEAQEAFEAVAEDADAAVAVERAMPLATEVRDVVSAPLIEDPAYAGALLSLLLLSESGIAEGWEEAAEGEAGPYAVGWAGMARAYELWEMLKPQASEDQTFEVEDQLEELQSLFQSPTPPQMEGADSEAAEGPAVYVAGFLEDVTGAWLFPGRDLAGLLRNTRDVAAAGCAAFDNGDELAGNAHIAWVGYAFGHYLAAPLGLFAPEPTAQLAELLAGVNGGAEEEEEGEEGGSEGVDATEEEGRELGFSPASCDELMEALDAAGEPLGV